MLSDHTLMLLGKLIVENVDGVEAALLGCEFRRPDELAYRLQDVLPLNWAEEQAKLLDQIRDLELDLKDARDENADAVADKVADAISEAIEELDSALYTLRTVLGA